MTKNAEILLHNVQRFNNSNAPKLPLNVIAVDKVSVKLETFCIKQIFNKRKMKCAIYGSHKIRTMKWQ